MMPGKVYILCTRLIGNGMQILREKNPAKSPGGCYNSPANNARQILLFFNKNMCNRD